MRLGCQACFIEAFPERCFDESNALHSARPVSNLLRELAKPATGIDGFALVGKPTDTAGDLSAFDAQGWLWLPSRFRCVRP